MQVISIERTLRFRLPETWEEASEDDGDRIFVEAEPEGGTLRVYLLTLSAPAGAELVNTRVVATMLEKLDPGISGVAEILPESRALLAHTQHDDEAGQSVTVHFWLLGKAMDASRVRVAVFAYTEGGERNDDVLKMLTAEIRAAELDDELHA